MAQDNIARVLAIQAKKAAEEGSLPPVTSSENGKVLGVVDGAWAPTKDALICTFTKSGNNISCDKTRAEILAAYDAGKPVYGKANIYSLFQDSGAGGDAILRLVNVDEANSRRVQFSCVLQKYDGTSFVCVIAGATVVSVYLWSAVIEDVASEDPLVVTYTITGQPVGGEYPMTGDTSLSNIFAAISAGRDVYAYVSNRDIIYKAPIVSFADADFVDFSTVTDFNGDFSIFYIHHGKDIYGKITPINTTVMQYNTTKDTLSITNVPEVS